MISRKAREANAGQANSTTPICPNCGSCCLENWLYKGRDASYNCSNCGAQDLRPADIIHRPYHLVAPTEDLSEYAKGLESLNLFQLAMEMQNLNDSLYTDRHCMAPAEAELIANKKMAVAKSLAALGKLS